MSEEKFREWISSEFEKEAEAVCDYQAAGA